MALRPSFISASLLRASSQYSLRGSQALVSTSSRPASATTARATLDRGDDGRFFGLRGNGGNGGDGDDLFSSNRGLNGRNSTPSENVHVEVPIVSYNVLSPPLAKASYFKYCDPADLGADVRLSRVLHKLEEAVSKKSIICLQEVSLSWSGPLHSFFARRGFQMILGTYGSYFNGYMGVAIAYSNEFEADDVRVQVLADTARWPRENPPNMFERAIQSFFGFFTNETAKDRKRNRSPWLQARDRKNVLIFARLRARATGASLCVGTYHMPCAFRTPPIMLIHSALAVATFQRLAKGTPGVLAGDFNIKPHDSAYRMITTGAMSPMHPDFPPDAPDGSPADKWFPRKFKPMRSAYAAVNGKEPEFTNYARTGDAPEFIETLDYLFCTDGVDVVDVLPLPKRKDVKGPFPVKNEPSDHIMIGATFRFPSKVKWEDKYRKGALYEYDTAA